MMTGALRTKWKRMTTPERQSLRNQLIQTRCTTQSIGLQELANPTRPLYQRGCMRQCVSSWQKKARSLQKSARTTHCSRRFKKLSTIQTIITCLHEKRPKDFLSGSPLEKAGCQRLQSAPCRPMTPIISTHCSLALGRIQIELQATCSHGKMSRTSMRVQDSGMIVENRSL